MFNCGTGWIRLSEGIYLYFLLTGEFLPNRQHVEVRVVHFSPGNASMISTVSVCASRRFVVVVNSFPVSGAIPHMVTACCNRDVHLMLKDNFQASRKRPSTSFGVENSSRRFQKYCQDTRTKVIPVGLRLQIAFFTKTHEVLCAP